MPRIHRLVTVNDTFQKQYRYTLVAPTGRNFHPDFSPQLTPAQMLRLGVFGGAYFIGVPGGKPHDLPQAWFRGVRLSPDGVKQAHLNFYGVQASQALAVWQRNGWISPVDPHGWFQWYCRYYLGRRLPAEDARQIRRWKAIQRHVRAIQKHCHPRDLGCRPRQRQAVLHWAYDSRRI